MTFTSEAVLRLHPDLPICWEDEHTLRIGFEQPIARLQYPSAGIQRLLQRLRRGLPEISLMREARRAGTSHIEAEELSQEIRQALCKASLQGHPPFPQSTPLRPLRTLLSDDGRTIEALRATLHTSRVCTIDHEGLGHRPELVINVQRFLEPPHRTQHWLTEQIPHLPIRFTDQAVHVGPLITPGKGPCCACLALHAVDADSRLPTLAAQLSGTTPGSERTPAAQLAASFALSIVTAWQAGRPEVHTQRVHISIDQGFILESPRYETVHPHPECSCGILNTPPHLTRQYPPQKQNEKADALNDQHPPTPKAATCLEHASTQHKPNAVLLQ